MLVGPMRQRVTLQRPTRTRDGFGMEQSAWAEVGTYWARVRQPRGRELMQAQQIQGILTDVIELRYIGPILTTDRFLFRGRTLNVLAVDNVENRDRQYLIHCQEVATPSP